MKKRTAVWAVAAFTAFAGIPQFTASQETVATGATGIAHAFVDVNVLPMDRERVLAGQTVLVADGRVVRMGTAAQVDVPDGATVIDEARVGEVIAATVEAGAGVVPTQVLWETFFGGRSGADVLAARPETRYWVRQSIPGVASGVNQWAQQTDRMGGALASPDAGRPVIELRRRLVKALHDAGVPVLLGTDSPQVFSVPGFSIHREMQVMVDSGLTPFQVLYGGTKAVADFLGAEDFGRVAEGQRADLVLLNANPLDDIGHFADSAGVMVNGRWLSRGEIDVRLAEIEVPMADMGR